MITQQQFLEIITNDLLLEPNGNVIIKDPTAAKEYADYLKQFAKKDQTFKPAIQNVGCVNVVCPAK